MDDASSSQNELLRRSRGGDARALGEMLERHRAYLRLLARRQLSDRLRVRLDESDIIQQTFLFAHRDLPQFEGNDAGEFAAWLLRIMDRCVQQAIRDHATLQKRALGREEPQSGDPEQQQGVTLQHSDPSPSQRAMQGEDAVRLARSLEQLPDDQREAVRLRYLEGWQLNQISQSLDKSPAAVAGLLKRGLRTLRQTI